MLWIEILVVQSQRVLPSNPCENHMFFKLLLQIVLFLSLEFRCCPKHGNVVMPTGVEVLFLFLEDTIIIIEGCVKKICANCVSAKTRARKNCFWQAFAFLCFFNWKTGFSLACHKSYGKEKTVYRNPSMYIRKIG